ncbi:uncharacterized protein LOC144129538 [Amblyomma americanum]
MPDQGPRVLYRLRDHIAGVNWQPTRFAETVPHIRICGLCRMIPMRTVALPCAHTLCECCHRACAHCWNEAHGCEFVGTMDIMLRHYETECQFHTVECPRCGDAVLHNNLALTTWLDAEDALPQPLEI